MDAANLVALISELRVKQDELLRIKGRDYTNDGTDRLSNFKMVAKAVGITPLQVWAVYWMKHTLAIQTYLQTGELTSESIEGRFLDSGNYGYLGMALIKEEEEDAKKAKTAIRDQGIGPGSTIAVKERFGFPIFTGQSAPDRPYSNQPEMPQVPPPYTPPPAPSIPRRAAERDSS